MPYNRNVLPNIGVDAIGYNPGVFTPTPFTLQSPDMNILSKTIDRMEQRQIAARQQQSNIAKMLGDIDLNAAEDEWKSNYINDIQEQIQSAIRLGDYSTAMNVASSLGNKIYTDPALKGRIKANKDYEESKQQVMSRNDIDQVTKDRWLAENKYHYEDTTDESGNIIGGTTWTPNWTPVKRLDRKDIYATLESLVKPEIGSNVEVVYMNENGEYTKDYREGTMGLAYKTSTGYSRITPEKFKRAFDKLWQQYPDAVKALEQEFKDNRFAIRRYEKEIENYSNTLMISQPGTEEYNNAEQNLKEATESMKMIKDSMTDREGNYISEEDYLKGTVYPMLGEMSFNNITHRDISVGDAAQNLYKVRQQQQAASNILKDLYNTDYGIGPTVEEQTLDNYTLTSTSIESAYNQLVKEWPMFGQTNSAIYKYMKDGNVDLAIKVAKRYLTNNVFSDIDSGKKSRMMDLLNIMEDNQATLNSLKRNIPNKTDRQAIAFTSAFNGGELLPNADKNEFTQAFNDIKDYIFGESNKIAIRLQTDSEDNLYRYTKALNVVGLKKEDIEGTGVEIKYYDDGMPYLIVPKTSKYTNKLLYGFSMTNDDFWHKWGNDSRVYRVNNDETIEDNITNNAYPYGVGPESIFQNIRYLINGASSRSTSSIKKAGKLTTYTPLTLYGTYGATDETLLDYRARGVIDESTYNTFSERNIKVKNALLTGEDLSNYKLFYDVNNEQGVLKEAGNEERNQIAEWFSQARDNTRAFNWQYGSKDGEYGVYIEFGSKIDKQGNPIESDNVYGGLKVWIPNMFADKAEKAVTRNTKTRTIKKLSDLQHYNTQYTTVFGNTISNVYNDGNNASAKINGKDVYYEQAQHEILKDLDFRNLEQIFNSTNFDNPNEAKSFYILFGDVMNELYPGLTPDDADYITEANNIMKLLSQRNSK